MANAGSAEVGIAGGGGATLRPRAAIIGLGRMGSTFDEEVGAFSRWQAPHAHAACYRAVADVELVAGADPHPAQRAAFGRRWGIDAARLYADHREMLERERPDLVSICTTARPRARILADVLATGSGVRAIWAEKPIAISLAEADEMVAGCRRRGILLAIGTSRCWDGAYTRMRELVERGRSATFSRSTDWGAAPCLTTAAT